MRCWKNASSLLLVPLLAGCLGQTPERARILDTRIINGGDGPQLEITHDLKFSPTMREALEHGIPLRLTYLIEGCDRPQMQALELRYSPLTRHFELQRIGDAQTRSFARSSALLAALDRVRMPVRLGARSDCKGQVTVALDLTSLPTPLRFPAFLNPEQWRLVSPPAAWPAS